MKHQQERLSNDVIRQGTLSYELKYFFPWQPPQKKSFAICTFSFLVLHILHRCIKATLLIF